MSRKKVDIILEAVRIEAVAAEGKALFHTSDGMVVFVPFAVPGDIADVRVTRKKKNYMEGVILAIRQASPDRLEPFCPHFGICGGCKWQTLPYRMQLEAKRTQVCDQLVRIGHLDVPEIRPTLPSARTRYYRNKLEYSASCRRWILPEEDPGSLAPEQLAGLGFHVGKFFDKVLDLRECHLQPEPSNSIRLFAKEYALSHGIPFYDIRANKGIFRTIFVRTSESGATMVIVCFAEEFAGRSEFLDAICNAFPQVSSLYYVINSKLNDSIADQDCILYSGNSSIYEEMEGLRFRIGPKSFYQTNTLQAYELYKVAREFAGLTGTETVYDLYTGTGTIAQFVSRGASKVIGIEYVEDAIEDARANAAMNGIGNCRFFAGDMKDILTPSFIAQNGNPDVVIVDPPRAGMHPDVVHVLMDASPSRIVYVSCNPASQARDLAMMCEKYEITDVQPVDMFPHTQHVENVCKLELKK